MSDAEDSGKYTHGVAAGPSNPVDNFSSRDAVRKLTEQLKQMEYDRKVGKPVYIQDGDTMVAKKGRTISIRDLQEISKQKTTIKETMSALQKSLESYEQLESKIDSLLFKIGDAAFVKHLGNVVITGIDFDESNLNAVSYITIGTTGTRVVAAAEVLPINDTTKVLYGNK